LVEAIRATEYWLMWATMACIVGVNVSTMNITSTIVKDRQITLPGLSQDPKQLGDMMQIICNSSSASFRLLGGVMFFLRPKLPKTKPLVVAGVITVVCQCLYATNIDGLALVAVCLNGVSDGIIWATAPLLTGVIFGMKSSGGIFGSMVMLGSAGVLIMGQLVEPFVYNAHVQPGQDACVGAACFWAFHVVAALVGASGALASIILHLMHGRTHRGTGKTGSSPL
jgi:hypothetical protein